MRLTGFRFGEDSRRTMVVAWEGRDGFLTRFIGEGRDPDGRWSYAYPCNVQPPMLLWPRSDRAAWSGRAECEDGRRYDWSSSARVGRPFELGGRSYSTIRVDSEMRIRATAEVDQTYRETVWYAPALRVPVAFREHRPAIFSETKFVTGESVTKGVLSTVTPTAG